jgi:hypothetical protein
MKSHKILVCVMIAAIGYRCKSGSDQVHLHTPCFNRVEYSPQNGLKITGQNLDPYYNQMELSYILSISAKTNTKLGFSMFGKGMNFHQNSVWEVAPNSIDSIIVHDFEYSNMLETGVLDRNDLEKREFHFLVKRSKYKQLFDLLNSEAFCGFEMGVVINTKTEKVFNSTVGTYAKNITYCILVTDKYTDCKNWDMRDELIVYKRKPH